MGAIMAAWCCEVEKTKRTCQELQNKTITKEINNVKLQQ